METMKALKVPDTETDPNDKSKRNKIIVIIIAIIALVCALMGITAAILHPHSQVEQAATCQNQQQVFTDKQAQLDQTIQDAKDALASVDASLEPGEGTRLMHTDGFPLSAEGQKAIADLDKATDKAKKFKNDNTVPQCPGEQDYASIDEAIKTLKGQTQSFIATRDAYRLSKATDEANDLMESSKSDLATAQKNASEQLAIVEADPKMQSNSTVKTAYDTLKAVTNESHTLSATVIVTSYDEAVASIEKANAVEQKATDVTASLAPLKDAVAAYQTAKQS